MPVEDRRGQASVAVIGGSGFYEFADLTGAKDMEIPTPFGKVEGVQIGEVDNKRVAFLSRHGTGHRFPPHKINYRANIWALHHLGVRRIFSLNAVGGIHSDMQPGSLVVPDQLIDYTFGREHTFAALLSEEVNHIDFTQPFSETLRSILLDVLNASGVVWSANGVYGCTQGPRLETAAEVRRLARDGCDVVGMTAMPEAALARELNMEYASLCPVVNWAAGIKPEAITLAEIHQILSSLNPVIRQLLTIAVQRLEY